ncbi:MAG: methyltransferase [Oscillospiraceae bacterium]|nr:methyltransferase [Oscillospiraceae bacterium]
MQDTKYEALQNGILLPQTDSLFKLGTDSVLLADFADPPRGAAVCDLCAGSGAVGLLLLARDPSLTVTAVELQAPSCEAMGRAVTENGLEDRVRVLQGDLREIRSLLPAGSFRQAVCNPPYYPAGAGFRPENEAQAIARTELCCTLGEVCAAAGWLLKTGGSLWMVHLPGRLADLFCALREAGLEPKRLRPVCPRPGTAPSLVLVKAVRGGKPELKWDAPLVLSNPDGSPTEEYKRIYHIQGIEN